MTSLSLPGPVSSSAPVPSDQPSEVISPIAHNNSNNTVPSPCAPDPDPLKSTDVSAPENKDSPCDVPLAQIDFQMNVLKN